MVSHQKLRIDKLWLPAVAVVALLLTTWRIIASGVGETLAQVALSADSRSTVGLQDALAWSTRNANTLYRVAVTAPSQDVSRQISQLEDALKLNPADGRVAITLAHLLLQQNQTQRADALAEHSLQLLPNDTNTLLQSARYWWERGNQERAMAHWGHALDRAPDLQQKLFPLFLQLLQQPGGLARMQPVLQPAPAWFADFFRYAAANASNSELVSRLYAVRSAVLPPVSAAENNTYLQFLEQEKRWDEAFIVWANGLSGDRLAQLGQPFNGGFESEPSGSGFDWRISEDAGVLIRTDYTYGIIGHKALHIVFRGQQVNFQHVWQRTLLPPRRYRMHGRVRPDSLQAAAGLQWRLLCEGDAGTNLGKSDRFVGVDQWREFSFDFQVPVKNCGSQVVRLVSVDNDKDESTFKGEIWFDDLRIDAI